jgi:plasmid stabilization system protein ParE
VAAGRVVFHPGASKDYAAAFAWYYARGTTLASDFEREIDRGIRLVFRNPLRWPKFDDQRRRLVVRKFPYSIIYELHGNDVVILAVAHGKRRPNYWRERSAKSVSSRWD